MKKISVIVPIYNKEKTLKRCIDSILNQTYNKLEIILVNDGSTDNSKEIGKEFVKSDRRVSLITQKNSGVSVARNTGISNSKGDYLVFVDPDDYISNNLIEILYETSINTKSDIVACCANVESEESIEKNSFFKKTSGFVDRERAIAQLLSDNYYNDTDKLIDIGVTWGKIYKKTIITKNNLVFNPRLRRNQDNVFNLYAFQFANDIYYIDTPLYYYNYENYPEVFNGLVDDAIELFSELAKETYIFTEKYYKDNLLLMDLCQTSMFLKLETMINKKILNPSFLISKQKRIKLLKEICESYPFRKVFLNKKIKYVKRNDKIKFYLLKFKLYSAFLKFKEIKSQTLQS